MIDNEIPQPQEELQQKQKPWIPYRKNYKDCQKALRKTGILAFHMQHQMETNQWKNLLAEWQDKRLEYLPN